MSIFRARATLIHPATWKNATAYPRHGDELGVGEANAAA